MIDYSVYQTEDELLEAMVADPDKFIIDQLARSENGNDFDAEICDVACRLTITKALVAQGLDVETAIDAIDSMGDITWDVSYDGDTGELSVKVGGAPDPTEVK